MHAKVGHIYLEQGKKVAIKVVYSRTKPGPARARLIWSKYDPAPDPAAIAAAKNADVVVAVLGITSQLEGEEMPVTEEGFKGGDRTSLDLPKPEQQLLEDLTATGKPVVLVLANGSALSVNWAKEHVNAILESWYSGEEGGAAVAETISGKNNPAGRLPVTFYTGVSQLPPFEDYSMNGRTYRYFAGKPLFPFGYGLSYTTFSLPWVGSVAPRNQGGRSADRERDSDKHWQPRRRRSRAAVSLLPEGSWGAAARIAWNQASSPPPRRVAKRAV